MPALHQAHANNLLDASLGTAAFVATSGGIHCRLMTANGSPTVAGVELASSGGYSAGAGAPNVTFSPANAGSATSSSAVTVTNMPATTITGIELWDGSPARKWYGALNTPKATNAGDTFSIAATALTTSLG